MLKKSKSGSRSVDEEYFAAHMNDHNTMTKSLSKDGNESKLVVPSKLLSDEHKNETPKRKHMDIGLRFRVDQIASINTVDQTYHAMCSLDMDWEATMNDVNAHAQDPRTYTPEKVPRIDPKNVVSKSVSYKPWANGNLNKLVEKEGKFYNLRRIEYDIVWSEPFEVKVK